MKKTIFCIMLLCFYAVFPVISFADDVPSFPPTLPFNYNGTSYYNVLAQIGDASACGGYKNIRQLVYYNKRSNFAITSANSYYGVITSVAVNGISQAVKFYSATQNDTVNYTVTSYAYPSGSGISGGQCSTVAMNPDSIYTNNDIPKPDGTFFKGANVVSPRLLSIAIYPWEGGSVTSDGISCSWNTLGNCQGYFDENSYASVTANANPGYILSYVQDGNDQNTDNPYSATMDKDRSLTVIFKPAFDWMLNPSSIPSFPPRVPFVYNGKTYFNVMAQIGNSSACGGYKNIRQLVYYNKSSGNTPPTTYNSYYGVVNGASSYGITQAIKFYSATQNDTVNYGITEYTNPSGVSIGGGQCATVAMDPSSVYTSNDILKPDSTVYKEANVLSPTVLSITIDPLEGGSVIGEGISCNVDTSSVCQYFAIKGSELALQANPKCGYAFDHWSWNNGANTSTNNLETFTMSGGLGVTGVFKKTFICTNGSFQQTLGYYGECVLYVRYETGIPWADFNGNADTTFQQAIDNDYATGNEPRVSAIIVFDRSSLPDVGHVGIVSAVDPNNHNHIWIQDANWYNDGMVHNHEIPDITQYNLKGYIYCAPPTN